jgi:hypothetical protein
MSIEQIMSIKNLAKIHKGVSQWNWNAYLELFTIVNLSIELNNTIVIASFNRDYPNIIENNFGKLYGLI